MGGVNTAPCAAMQLVPRYVGEEVLYCVYVHTAHCQHRMACPGVNTATDCAETSPREFTVLYCTSSQILIREIREGVVDDRGMLGEDLVQPKSTKQTTARNLLLLGHTCLSRCEVRMYRTVPYVPEYGDLVHEYPSSSSSTALYSQYLAVLYVVYCMFVLYIVRTVSLVSPRFRMLGVPAGASPHPAPLARALSRSSPF